MKTFRLNARARRDVARIWDYIALDNERAADAFIERLVETFQTLGQNPRAGRQRDDLGPGYRTFPVGEYLIIYRAMAAGVRINHVVHGRRDLSKYKF